MKDKAIQKLTADCEAQKETWRYSAMVNLEEHYSNNMTDKVAEKILKEDKSLTSALDAIYNHAAANRKGGKCVCMTDEERYSIADAYFEITPDDWKEEKKIEPIHIKGTMSVDILDFI